MDDAAVLLVEDEETLRGSGARGLRERGLQVTTAADGAAALAAAGGGPDTRFAAVVLDIGLPDSDGRDVCHALRARGIDVPVVFLTARDQLHDVLAGFAAGGDDHLAKPVHRRRLAGPRRGDGGHRPGVGRGHRHRGRQPRRRRPRRRHLDLRR